MLPIGTQHDSSGWEHAGGDCWSSQPLWSDERKRVFFLIPFFDLLVNFLVVRIQ